MKIVPTVDIIIQKKNKIALIKRSNQPFKNKLAIPGGRLDEDETFEQAAVREAEEETSLKVKLKEILGVYSDPSRSPPPRRIAVVFIAEPIGGELKAKTDAAKAGWVEIKNIKFNQLGFDHAKILKDYIKWKKSGGTFWSSKA